MALHDQQPKKPDFICETCKVYDCEHCVDIMRERAFKDPPQLCKCKHEYMYVTLSGR